MKPKNRLEHFLGRIAGNENAKNLKPKNRMEYFLSKLGGGYIENVNVDEVTYRYEDGADEIDVGSGQIRRVRDFMSVDDLIGCTFKMGENDEVILTKELLDEVSGKEQGSLPPGYTGTDLIVVVNDITGKVFLVSADASFDVIVPGLYFGEGVTLTIPSHTKQVPMKELKPKNRLEHFLNDIAESQSKNEASSEGGDDSVLVSLIDRSITEINNDEVTSVGNHAFLNCSALTTVDLPNATSIRTNAFSGCSALITVDLPNVTSIGIDPFMDISSNTIINLGAAEGEIEGAPWGAPDGVTINYNVKSIPEE